MNRKKTGCGCALVLLVLAVVAALLVYFYFYRQREEMKLPPPSGDEMRVVFLDVGQGDCVIIRSPAGKYVLVDAGNPGNGKKILESLRGMGAEQVDLMVATHAHADHIGSADEVMRGIKVARVLDSKIPNTTKNYQDFLQAIAETGAQYIVATPDLQPFDLGGGAVLRTLAPIAPAFTKEQLRTGGNEPNANSVVTRVDYGEFSLLLTGDAEAQTEQRLISNDANIRARVLKVGHHGSRYATSEEFLRRGQFQTAIISDGEKNLYGHPNQETLDRLRALNIKLYRTDLHGTITITTRGKGDYEIKPDRELSGTNATALWTGRQPKRDDSARTGFVDFGDYVDPNRSTGNRNRNRNSGGARGAASGR